MPTPNYGWERPTVGGSGGAWGTMLNTIIGSIDSVVKAVSDVADAALARAGGVMTGRLDVHSDTHKVVALGSVSGSTNFNLNNGRFFRLTLSGNASVVFQNVPTGTDKATFLVIEVTNGGSYTLSWPSTVKWPGGVAPIPSVTANGVDVFTLFTHDAGGTWRATRGMLDSR